MNLFSKDKELIFKIVNGIFLIWFIAAVVWTANSLVNIIIPDQVPTYKEYRLEQIKSYPEQKDITNAEMKKMYDQTYSYQNIYELRGLLTGMANVVIVGGAIYILNRTPKKKD